jgi:hypothetical protein
MFQISITIPIVFTHLCRKESKCVVDRPDENKGPKAAFIIISAEIYGWTGDLTPKLILLAT